MEDNATINKSKVAFTAVPHGISESGVLKIAVLVTPEPYGGEGLGFSNWAGWVQTHNSFAVQVGNAPPVHSVGCNNHLLASLWSALFANIRRLN